MAQFSLRQHRKRQIRFLKEGNDTSCIESIKPLEEATTR